MATTDVLRAAHRRVSDKIKDEAGKPLASIGTRRGWEATYAQTYHALAQAGVETPLKAKYRPVTR